MVLVESHGIPTVLSPVLPVLHQDIDRQLLIAEAIGGLKNLVGRMETFAAVDITQRPSGHQGSDTSQFAVACDNLVSRTDKHGVVDSGGHG